MAILESISAFFDRAQDYFGNLDALALSAWGAIVLGIVLILVGSFL